MPDPTRADIAAYQSVTDAANAIGVDGSVLRRSIIDDYLPATRVGGMWFVNNAVLEAFVTLGREEGRPTPYMEMRRRWVGDLLQLIAALVPPIEAGARPARAPSPVRRASSRAGRRRR